jgi:hypothetical protein
MDDFFIILASNTSIDDFPQNSSSDFVCKLPEDIQINFDYRVALIDLILPPISKEGPLLVSIYSDVVGPTIYSSSLSNVLRVTVPNRTEYSVCHSFDNPIYIPVGKSSFNTLSILFTDHLGQKIKFKKSISSLTLHFKHFP